MTDAVKSKSHAVYYAAEHRLVLEIIFNPQEAALFGLLARNRGRIVPHDIKIVELWPKSADEPSDPENAAAVQLHNLRAKLSPLAIETCPGTGLRMNGKLEIDWSVPDL